MGGGFFWHWCILVAACALCIAERPLRLMKITVGWGTFWGGGGLYLYRVGCANENLFSPPPTPKPPTTFIFGKRTAQLFPWYTLQEHISCVIYNLFSDEDTSPLYFFSKQDLCGVKSSLFFLSFFSFFSFFFSLFLLSLKLSRVTPNMEDTPLSPPPKLTWGACHQLPFLHLPLTKKRKTVWWGFFFKTHI